MEIAYSTRYRDLYHRHWWWRAREEVIVAQLRQLAPAAGWSRILDVGCGDGLFFARLGEFGAVEGVEPDPEMVSADSPHRARIHVGPFDASFQPKKLYALILMLDVLEHVPEPAVLLRRALDLLQPEGALFVTVPAFRMLWTTHDEVNHHLTRYTKGRFRRLARDVGLRIDRARYFFHALFFAKLAVRVYERVRRPAPTVPDVPPAWLNRAAYGLCRLDETTVGRLPVPFGSSLMVIGGHERPGGGA